MRAAGTAIFLALMLTSLAGAEVITVLPGENGTGIQRAIDMASPGDVIDVQGGTYKESINVTKALTLRRTPGSTLPVVDAGGSEYAIMLFASGVRIEGLRATNSSDYGILVASDDNLLLNCTSDFNLHAGIALDESGNNTLSGNTVCWNGGSGIELEGSDGNVIRFSVAMDNGDAGIEVSKSEGNEIIENLALNNSNDGIELLDCENNTVMLNRADKNKDGICLEESRMNNITQNSAVRCQVSGILLRYSSKNSISDNNISGCHHGIFLESSPENTVANNSALSNRIGISINYYSSDNTIYRNILYNNLDCNAYDESGRNQWDDGRYGNFYGDPVSPDGGCQDKDGDGICDKARPAQGGDSIDRYPLILSVYGLKF